MNASISAFVETVAAILETIGIAVIIIGAALALASCIRPLVAREMQSAYRRMRQNLGRSILLGLEFLVAADIVNTVAERPTLTSVAILGGIVAIRTFLSFTLTVEIDGRWPWQSDRDRLLQDH